MIRQRFRKAVKRIPIRRVWFERQFSSESGTPSSQKASNRVSVKGSTIYKNSLMKSDDTLGKILIVLGRQRQVIKIGPQPHSQKCREELPGYSSAISRKAFFISETCAR